MPPPQPETIAEETEAQPIETPPPQPRAAPEDTEAPPAKPRLWSRLRWRRETHPQPEEPPHPDQLEEAGPEIAEESEPSPLLIAPPDQPHLSISQPVGDGSYALTWNAVPEATYYVLQESTRMGFSEGKQATVRGATEWHVNARPPGTYYYRVRAHTDDDFGEWSNIVFTKIEPEED
jgi:hypothetical protein